MQDFAGKVAVVTGAGRNVGLVVAQAFARAGMRVVVAENDEARGRAAVEALEAGGGGAGRFVACDVASEDSVQQMVSESVETLGPIDVLVNNVAITDRGSTILDLELDTWRRVLDVTLTSAYLCTKHVGRVMVERGEGGAIINIGSTSAHVGRRNALAYGIAKAGVLSLTRSSAVQLGPHGIRVNAVSPNKVGSPVGEDTEPAGRARTNALGRGAEPADVAGTVLFLASPGAGFITGAEVVVDGGTSIMPR